MDILHVAPHLGGGVGKAHAALAEARRESGTRERHRFVLLESPQDRRFADRVAAAGGEIIVGPDAARLEELVAEADILQVEWWSHPRLFEFLARSSLPAHRLVLWTHISGLSAPVIPAQLTAIADRTAFTSACSFDAANLTQALADRPEQFAVANSGFGFPPADRSARPESSSLRFGFLGTLDFAKLHPGLFDAMDAVRDDIRLRLFGQVDPTGAVAAKAAAMQHPERIILEGHTDEPAKALSQIDVFVYPLTAGHYGTGENALVEAMSLGLCPLVLDNPAERAIVTHGETGIVANGIEDLTGWLDWIADHPGKARQLGAEAARRISKSHSPTATLATFASVYEAALEKPKRVRDFATALGSTPEDWFRASLGNSGDLEAGGALFTETAAKGSLAHFRQAFPHDPGLQGLAG